ncbi:MAG: TIGR01777 family protein [Oscillatoriales cyanobacterium]|nr:MAG: TIGR01777 family protein [Oscillatoriales cyanobacterium]
MKVAITGATGFVGRALVQRLSTRGDRLVLFTRDQTRAARCFPPEAFPEVSIVGYQPTAAGDWQAAIAGCDAVINLAGAGIADGRWTEARKQEILSSRQGGTRRIVEAIAAANPRPSVLINSSAIGFYGTSETATFTEASSAGKGFLAEVCQSWEAEAQAVTVHGTRLAILRTGIVLGDGGALGKMLPAFRAFAGGPLGSGQQWFSWIHLADLVALIERAIDDDQFSGTYNATAPNPVRMQELCQLLGNLLQRPSWLPVPAFALDLLLGEAAQVVLEGQRVLPDRTQQSGFEFRYSLLRSALEAII